MPAPEIHIDRIRLDLRGVAPETARAAVASLGPALEAALTDRRAHFSDAAPSSIARVSLPPLQLPAGASAAALRAALAQQLAAGITSHLPEGSAGGRSTGGTRHLVSIQP